MYHIPYLYMIMDSHQSYFHFLHLPSSTFVFVLLFFMGDHFNLPPGFRFYPTDEELVVHFLHCKAALLPCHPDFIPDLALHPYNPWDLHGKAMREGNKWYFYSRRTPRRVTESGQWLAFGREEAIYSNGQKIGLKKHLAFYIGSIKTNWIMHEFTLLDPISRNTKPDFSKWVICRVYEDGDSDGAGGDGGAELSCLDEVFLSIDDDLDEISSPNLMYKRKTK